MDFPNLSLTEEQSFELEKFKRGVVQLPKEALEDHVVQLFRQNMCYCNVLKQAIKQADLLELD